MSHILHLLAASSLAMTFAACSSHADESSQNIFDGKTFSVLGDSYSTFVGAVTPDTNYVWYTPQELEHNCTDVDSVSQIWWSIVADSLHMNLLQNNSFSGATVCNRGYNGDDYSDRSFITRQDNLPTSDYIFIFGGTNDSWAGAPVGTYDYDCFDADSLYTFRPAMALLLSRLKTAQPNAQIFVLINSQLRSEITESLMAIADHYDATYVTLYDIAKQCGHPTNKGQQAIAYQLIRSLYRSAGVYHTDNY